MPLVGSFRIAPERAAAVLAGLDAEAGRIVELDSEGGAQESQPGRRPRGCRVDALVRMCERSLDDASAEAPGEAAERYQLVLHSTVEELGKPDGADDDDPVGSEVQTPGGGPAQIHHIRHWANGGPTCLRNLISLCDGHHWLVHEGGLTLVRRSATSWALLGPTGIVAEPVPAAADAVAPLSTDPTIAADAVTGDWSGEQLDYYGPNPPATTGATCSTRWQPPAT